MGRFCLSLAAALALSACATGVSFQSARLGSAVESDRVHALFAKPPGKGPFPAVLLLHTCGGVMGHVSEDWPAFLNGIGYAALTVDTFGSRGAGRCPEARRYGGPTMWQDAYGALDYLAGRPDIDADRIAVMGFSLGAMAIESFVGNDVKSDGGRNFAAGISVYGRCDLAGQPSFPILLIIGDKDRNVYSCPTDSKDPRISTVILPGATHAFDNSRFTSMRIVSGNHPAIYSWTATKQAREATQAFLGKQMAK